MTFIQAPGMSAWDSLYRRPASAAKSIFRVAFWSFAVCYFDRYGRANRRRLLAAKAEIGKFYKANRQFRSTTDPGTTLVSARWPKEPTALQDPSGGPRCAWDYHCGRAGAMGEGHRLLSTACRWSKARKEVGSHLRGDRLLRWAPFGIRSARRSDPTKPWPTMSWPPLMVLLVFH